MYINYLPRTVGNGEQPPQQLQPFQMGWGLTGYKTGAYLLTAGISFLIVAGLYPKVAKTGWWALLPLFIGFLILTFAFVRSRLKDAERKSPVGVKQVVEAINSALGV